jgi:hypothetical protein
MPVGFSRWLAVIPSCESSKQINPVNVAVADQVDGIGTPNGAVSD